MPRSDGEADSALRSDGGLDRTLVTRHHRRRDWIVQNTYPLPDGTNLKATMMLEYPDAAERRVALERLTGIENSVYVEVGALGRVFAHADEDLERSDGT